MCTGFVTPMDVLDPEQDARLNSVAEILRRERPVLGPDEIERVDRRLRRSRPPPRACLPGSRLAVVFCLSFGFLLMTAGTGLALSGFATPGPAVQAQYPGTPAGSVRLPGHERAVSRRPQARPANSSRLGRLSLTGGGTTLAVGLRQAETRADPPFTGVQALPILGAGMALFLTGGLLNRRTG